MDAALQQERRAGMAEIVDARMGQPGPLERRGEEATDARGVEQPPVDGAEDEFFSPPLRAGGQPFLDLARAMLAERGQRERRQMHSAPALLRLGLHEDQAGLSLTLERALDR